MAQSYAYPSLATIQAKFISQGIEEITENNTDYLLEFRQMLWRLLNRTESGAALSVFAYTSADGTFKVQEGYYVWQGTVKSYAGSGALNPTHDDTTYVWMTEENTVDSGIDGDGWPIVDHIKLAEVTDTAGVITNVVDRRPIFRGVENDPTYNDILCAENEVLCAGNNVLTT